MIKHLKIVRILARNVIANVIVIRYTSFVIIYLTYCFNILNIHLHIILELKVIKTFLFWNISFVFCWR